MSKLEELNLRAFLESVPPHRKAVCGDFLIERGHPQYDFVVGAPDLWLECLDEHCRGYRWFAPGGQASVQQNIQHGINTLRYICKNCGNTSKYFSVVWWRTADRGIATASVIIEKMGELPPFGPSVPSALISLIGPDREEFLAGRRCENQGMGIGAFAYYRRIVENQKVRILDSLIKVAERTGSPQAIIKTLERAKGETQFSSAIDIVKDGIPEAMKIDGHNPLTLLHNALSDGIHAMSDSECLEVASAIRVVLTRFAGRSREILQDENELREAVSKLNSRRASKPQ